MDLGDTYLKEANVKKVVKSSQHLIVDRSTDLTFLRFRSIDIMFGS